MDMDDMDRSICFLGIRRTMPGEGLANTRDFEEWAIGNQIRLVPCKEQHFWIDGTKVSFAEYLAEWQRRHGPLSPETLAHYEGRDDA